MFPLDIYPEAGYGSSRFNGLRNLRTVSRNDCTNLQSHQQRVKVLVSPHSLQHFYFLTLWWSPSSHVCGDISLWFSFASPRWLVALSIFPCTYWPLTCLLWKNIYPHPLPSFKSDCFCYWVVWVLSVFWILTFCQHMSCKYFLPLCRLPLHVADCLLNCAEAL